MKDQIIRTKQDMEQDLKNLDKKVLFFKEKGKGVYVKDHVMEQWKNLNGPNVVN